MSAFMVCTVDIDAMLTASLHLPARRQSSLTWYWPHLDAATDRGTWTSAEPIAQADQRRHELTAERCPLCGNPIGAANVRAAKPTRRVFVHCGDDLSLCPFSKGGDVAEGIPVLSVDEEICRMPPAWRRCVIASVRPKRRSRRGG
jgi:hypothetical protein